MKDETIETLTPLLEVLRGYSALEEVGVAAFHLKHRDFIHFHEDEPEGLVADVRLVRGRIRMPVSTREQQADLLERIEQDLASLEAGSRRSRKGRHGRHSRKPEGPWEAS